MARQRLAGRGVRTKAHGTGALERLHLPREVLALGAQAGIADKAFLSFLFETTCGQATPLIFQGQAASSAFLNSAS